MYTPAGFEDYANKILEFRCWPWWAGEGAETDLSLWGLQLATFASARGFCHKDETSNLSVGGEDTWETTGIATLIIA